MSCLPAARHLLRARDLADRRYAEPVTVADMARAAHLSSAHFSRAFRRTFGESPHQYLLTRRLERAAALLRTTDWTVARICIAVGIQSQPTFTTSFDAAGASAFRVVGTEGDLHAEPAYEYAEALAYTLTKGDQTRKTKGKKRDQFAAEILYFSDCIRKDQTPEPSGEEGAWDVHIIDALYESARRGEPISLRPFEDERAPRRSQAISRPPVREPELVNVQKPHED